MIKEYYTYQDTETTIQVEDATIKAIKNKNIINKSVRVFEPETKRLSLASGVGDILDSELEKKAIDLLSLDMKYEYELEKDTTGHFTKTDGKILGETPNYETLKKFTEKTLTDLKDISKDYVLTGEFQISNVKVNLKNTLNLDLSRQIQHFYTSLTMKLKGSGNIADTWTNLSCFDLTDKEYNGFLKDTEFMAKVCMSSEIPLEAKEYKILFPPSDIWSMFYHDVRATGYEQKTSLLAGRQGDKIFHESININECHDNDELVFFSPFDDEGILRKEELPIIENGILKTILYDKKQAAKYGKISTGNGFRNYAAHPQVWPRTFYFCNVQPKATDMISEDLVIYPVLTSGENFLENGNFSMPVMLALVFKNGKFIGKAPKITITGNYLDTFNKDFKGVCKNDIMPVVLSKTLVFASAMVNVN